MDLLFIARFITHYGLHFIFPGIISWVFFKDDWKKVWAIMAATIVVDIDHALATPLFDPNRCSIGFHPLHSYLAICIYFLMLLIPNKYVRIVAFGLLFHMLVDFQDCLWMGISSQINVF